MRVKVAGTAGFCWGVQRALRGIDGVAKDGKKTRTYGSLVFNGPVLLELRERGVESIEKPALAAAGDRIVSRPHGMLDADRKTFEEMGTEVLDLTCPHVASTRDRVREMAAAGRNVLVAGNREHDEVKYLLEGITVKSWVIATVEDARTVAAEPPLGLVCQSTFGPALFEDVVEAVRERFDDAEIRSTLCGATEDRQEETRKLAEEADVLVVVGAYHSGNARRLAEMCRETGKQTFHVEVPDDLPVGSLVEQARLARRQALMEKYADEPDRLLEATSDPARLDAEVLIGVTAGASTPPWVLRQILDHLLSATRADLEQGLPRDLAERPGA